jgi:hypothetical protein
MQESRALADFLVLIRLSMSAMAICTKSLAWLSIRGRAENVRLKKIGGQRFRRRTQGSLLGVRMVVCCLALVMLTRKFCCA